MRSILSWMILGCFVSWGPSALAADEPLDLGDYQKLSILYAGAPGDERETAWVEFLGQHFAKVGKISLEELSNEAAAGYDVVVADWKSRYVDGEYQSDRGHRVRLDRSFSKPVIGIGAVGAEIARRTSKLTWL